MIITNENYHQFGNKALSRSKISDFLKSKPYFKAKHIDGTIIEEPKKAWDIGNGVDALLAQIDNKHKFIVCNVDRRTKAGKEEYEKMQQSGSIILNDNEYEQIMGMALAVEATDAYKEIISQQFKKQEVLQMPWNGGKHFDSIVAMPDYIKIDNGTARIWDLKTAMTIDERKYYYHCVEYGYFLQMAVMKLILDYPIITNWEFGHIVVEKTKNIWNVQTFILDSERIEMEKQNLVDNILPMIAAETEFKPYNPSLSSAIAIGSISSSNDENND